MVRARPAKSMKAAGSRNTNSKTADRKLHPKSGGDDSSPSKTHGKGQKNRKGSKPYQKKSTKTYDNAEAEDTVGLVTGPQDDDPSLVGEVSSFLDGLKQDKGSEARTKSVVVTPSGQTKTKTRPGKGKIPKTTDGNDKDSKDSSLPTPKISLPRFSKQTKFVVDPNPHWYEAIPPLPAPPGPLATPTQAQLTELTSRASTMFTSDAATYQSSAASTSSSASDAHFLQTILVRGTLSDRLSALTLLVQSSPSHNSKALETLKGMAERGRGKGGREEGLKAVRCVVDWWVGGGGPPRKLRYFRDQPLLHPSVTDQHLVLWFFEDWLKKYFFAILQILETYSLDPLTYVRTQSLAFISTLLREKPEQEQNLLRLLVNKLGDTEKSICSRASYHLLQLLQAHPNMKGVIVREVKALIFRPAASSSAAAQAGAQAAEKKASTHVRFGDGDDEGDTKAAGKRAPAKPAGAKDKGGRAGAPAMERWNSHAWYYAAVTLNQVVLAAGEHDRAVARTLIGVYFEMFQEILGAAGGSASRDVEDERDGDAGEAESEDEGRGGAKDGKAKGKGKGKGKGRSKEVRGAAGFAEVEDTSSRLVSAVLTGVNRALPFAKVTAGAGDDVFKRHIDTLFLITHTSTFNISLQALVLLLQIVTALGPASAPRVPPESFAASLADRFYRTLYASLADARLAASNKQAMYLNLLFRALKADHNSERVKAFVRRFVQVLAAGTAGGGGAEFVAGGLYLLGELFGALPALRDMLASERGGDATAADAAAYDPLKRDPQFAHASASPLYELLPLLRHYHPAVALHARQLLAGAPLTAAPDLALNTLAHFLDRFVYRNAKKPRAGGRGPSAMQPAAGRADGVRLVRGGEVEAEAVNEEAFWRRRAEDVPVDQLFFHRFFTRKKEQEERKAARAGKRKACGAAESGDESADKDEGAVDDGESGGEAADDGESDVGEGEIWEAMKASMPAELQDDDLMEDSGSDGVPFGLEDESDEDGSGSEVGDGGEEGGADRSEDSDGSADGDSLSLAEASDAEDLLPLDAEVPTGLIEYDGSDAPGGSEDEEEWGGIGVGGTASKKRKRGEEGAKGRGRGKGRKKLRALPTFASYEAYAAMIEDGPEDDV
ncbi:hypothetical protein AcV5_001742 [Taiwanofungus camphoratus]|nr:hypothetical protein AcV5_001742 [Antrodia cinnamomea]